MKSATQVHVLGTCPWLGIEPAILWSTNRCSNHWETQPMGTLAIFIIVFLILWGNGEAASPLRASPGLAMSRTQTLCVRIREHVLSLGSDLCTSWLLFTEALLWVAFRCALSGRGLVFQATDISLQFSCPELLWSLKRLENIMLRILSCGGWGTYIGKTWVLELDHGLTEVFPSQYPCSSNNCYMGVAMPSLSASHLPLSNHSAPPCGPGRGCQSWHSFSWKRVMWSKKANHRVPTSQWHNSRKNHVTQIGPLRLFSGIIQWVWGRGMLLFFQAFLARKK